MTSPLVVPVWRGSGKTGIQYTVWSAIEKDC